MKNILNFLIEAGRLKEMPRTGWVWLGVKNPETIAEHLFRIAFASRFLAEKRNLNVKRAVETALFHDLCEVYSGDMTSYFGLLPKNREKRVEVLKRWIRLPQKEKEKRNKRKFQEEKKSLLKLISSLEPRFKQRIMSLWLDYEKGISREGRFVKQVDKIETMIQAIEYFGVRENTPVVGWWEETEEVVEDPLLLRFLKVIEKRFYHKLKRVRDSKRLEAILELILRVGKLKRMPRSGWVLRGVRNPETIAGHTFSLTLMAWIFSKKTTHKLDEEKLLKMALCHEICEIYAGDTTPYEPILSQGKKVFKKWIRFSKKEKRAFFLKDYKKEKKALQKLLFGLTLDLKKEIIGLWDEFKGNRTREARFLHQLYTMQTLLQALLYWRKDKKFPIESWWEWAYEIISQPLALEFLKELKKKFYKRV